MKKVWTYHYQLLTAASSICVCGSSFTAATRLAIRRKTFLWLSAELKMWLIGSCSYWRSLIRQEITFFQYPGRSHFEDWKPHSDSGNNLSGELSPWAPLFLLITLMQTKDGSLDGTPRPAPPPPAVWAGWEVLHWCFQTELSNQKCQQSSDVSIFPLVRAKFGRPKPHSGLSLAPVCQRPTNDSVFSVGVYTYGSLWCHKSHWDEWPHHPPDLWWCLSHSDTFQRSFRESIAVAWERGREPFASSHFRTVLR